MATVDKPQSATADAGARDYKVIGTRPIRHDGVDKVTGRARYGADIALTGMLHGAVLRSPHAHAKILSIDTSAAKKLPGVRAVVTHADLPDVASKVADLGEGMFDLRDLSRNVLAHDKVLYRGHAVAAVAADNVHIADEALRLIEVKYEVLTPVMDVVEAMQDGAPILHDDLRTEGFVSSDDAADKPTNIAKVFLHEKGNLEQGFAEADLVNLAVRWPLNRWPVRDVYFGGVNAMAPDGQGAGDPRRGGHAAAIDRT